MKGSDSGVGRTINEARRRRKLSQSGMDLESQGAFFPSPVTAKADPFVKPVSASAPDAEEAPDPELTVDQAEALRKVEAAYAPGEFYLLTGTLVRARPTSCNG